MTDIGGEDGDGAVDRATEAADPATNAAARRRREFIRAHHPDRGGDTESFIAGLRMFDSEQAPAGAGPQPRVTVFARRAWPSRLVTAAVRRIRHGKPPARVR
jgi:hypothetical protein